MSKSNVQNKSAGFKTVFGLRKVICLAFVLALVLSLVCGVGLAAGAAGASSVARRS